MGNNNKPVSQEIRAAVIQAKAIDPGIGSRDLGKQFGLHHKTINKILKAADIPRQVEKEWSGLNDALRNDPAVEAKDEELSGEWVQGKSYTYNGDLDTYVSFLKCRTKPLVLSGARFRSMKKAYSNWNGNESTINEVCRQFSIPRDQFMELKAVHGWTHDQEPYTREEVLTRDTDDLAEDAFQQRRQAVWESFEKKKWHQTKLDAEKWNNLEQTFWVPLQEQMAALAPTYHVPTLFIRQARNPFAVVTGSGELHYGKAGWVYETGEEFNRHDAGERLVRVRSMFAEELAERGRPEKIFYVAGNDQVTIDTDKGTTSAGTYQDLDGSSAQIYCEAHDLIRQDVDAVRSIAPVEVLAVPGNPDRILTIAMMKSFQGWFQNQVGVDIRFSARSRAYADYGSTAMGFAHGDGALRPKDYMATMAKDDPERWARTVYRAFFTGHLHSEVVRELIGGTHFQMPSLSGKDRYHERNAYLADAALASYVVDKLRGVTSTIMNRV